MKNQFSTGDAVDVVAPVGGMVSGQGYQFGAALFGIASLTTPATAAPNVIYVVGVFTGIKKLSTDAWAVGDILYWDNTLFQLTKTVASNLKVGVALNIVNAGGIVGGQIRLTPG